jgi:hypothetical protein
MGIDVCGLMALKFASNFGPFGRTLTLGRQQIHVDNNVLRQAVNDSVVEQKMDFCESFLMKWFGAKCVDSADISGFEGASIICDLGKPVPPNLHFRWDTIIDFGTSEHVFEFPTLLENIRNALVYGGQILHVLPANNFCGHGFYQFSPDLFLQVYSEINGYSSTEVFIAEISEPRKWRRITKREDGSRLDVSTKGSAYVVVRSKKSAARTNVYQVYQSDYFEVWGDS